MRISLGGGAWADIISRDDVTERVSRAINRSYLAAAGVAAKLNSLGFDETKPETWGAFSGLPDSDRDSLDGYQAELIVGMVFAWSYPDLPTLENVLDLPKSVFESLAKACADEFNGTALSAEPDVDPDSPTAASPA